MRRAPCVVLVVLCALLWARAVSAFTSGTQFDLDALTADGASGLPFTGSPRLAGHTCEVCHINTPKRIAVRLEVDRLDLFKVGYEPGETYHIRVELLHEWAGRAGGGPDCGNPASYVPCNDNGFALEIDDEVGQPVGGFDQTRGGRCGHEGTEDLQVYVLADGSAVTHAGAASDQTFWDLCWTAPEKGSGPLVAYVTAVDGGGGDGTRAFANDTLGDDTFQGVLPISERGGRAAKVQTGGCSTATAAGSSLAALALLALLAILPRRMRALIALVVALSAGCGTVQPWQREHMAKRIMKFGVDPDETELDQHMLEAREGSAGGYGSSGGGCGCN